MPTWRAVLVLGLIVALGCGQDPAAVAPLQGADDEAPEPPPVADGEPAPLSSAEPLPAADVAAPPPATPAPVRLADDSAEIAQLRRRVAKLETEVRQLRSELRTVEQATTPDVATLQQLPLDELQGRFVVHRATGGNKDLARALALAIAQNHPGTDEGRAALGYLAWTVSRNDPKAAQRYQREILRYHSNTDAAAGARRALAYAVQDDLEEVFRLLEPLPDHPGSAYPNVGTAKWLRRQVKGTNHIERAAVLIERLANSLPQTARVIGVERPSFHVATIRLQRGFLYHHAGDRAKAAAVYAHLARHLSNPHPTLDVGQTEGLMRVAQEAKEWLAKLEAGEPGPAK